MGENAPLTGLASTLPGAVEPQLGVFGATADGADVLAGAVGPATGASTRSGC